MKIQEGSKAVDMINIDKFVERWNVSSVSNIIHVILLQVILFLGRF